MNSHLDSHSDIRDAIRALCAEFPDAYHRKIDAARGYEAPETKPSACPISCRIIASHVPERLALFRSVESSLIDAVSGSHASSFRVQPLRQPCVQ